MGHSKKSHSIIDAQIALRYESGSIGRDAFSQIMSEAPTQFGHYILTAAWIDTALGPMIAIADDQALYFLAFMDQRGLQHEITNLRQKYHAAIIPGSTPIIQQIEVELTEYFKRKRWVFFANAFMRMAPHFKQLSGRR